MSADELRKAAETLRAKGRAATRGPWTTDEVEATRPYWTVESPDSRGGFSEVDCVRWQDADYIATMHPGVGLALADWLDDAADWEDVPRTVNHDMRAHDIARLINGGAA